MDKKKKQQIRMVGSISWEERQELIKEYLEGDLTKTEIWKKYTGQCQEHGRILTWMRQLGYLEDKKPPQSRQRFIMSREQSSSSLKISKNPSNGGELGERVKKLEKELELSKLEVEGYKMMIDIAEKEFKIPIKKKPDTK